MFDRLLFDNDMNQFLAIAGRDNKIALILLNGSGNLIVEDGNFIKRESSEIDVLSFLPKSKIEKVEDVWESKSRTKIKIGRFIKKFLSKLSFEQYCITDQDVEKFVNLYKSFFTKDLSKLKIVEGNDSKILSVFTYKNPEANDLLVTIKTNRVELNAVLQTFNRYQYNVVASYHTDAFGDDLKARYDLFMNYINM